MRLKIRAIFKIMTITVRSDLTQAFGRDFYRRFSSRARKKLEEILPQVPDIGDSIFALNYLYGPCYFSWYEALRSIGLDPEIALTWIWRINEDFIRSFPKPLLHWFAKNMYLGAFRRKAVEAERRGKAGELYPFDWRVEYVDINPNKFGINIFECGMLKLADRFGYREMFPAVCRMDYLFSHYFDNSFIRTGTLADGNQCCNCLYEFPGKCEWAPEKGFSDRK
jgi:hypothetical protein